MIESTDDNVVFQFGVFTNWMAKDRQYSEFSGFYFFSFTSFLLSIFLVLVDWISKRNGKWLDYKVQNDFNFFNVEMVKLNVWHICGETVCASVLIFDALGDALQRHHLQALSLPLVNDSFINSLLHSFIHCSFCRVNPPNVLWCYILWCNL